jgi:hypothetical protein
MTPEYPARHDSLKKTDSGKFLRPLVQFLWADLLENICFEDWEDMKIAI